MSHPSTPELTSSSLFLFLADLSFETVPGAAVVSVAVGSPAAAVSIQPGEGAAEPTAERYAGP